MVNKKVIIKSSIVGFSVALFDLYIHNTHANIEVLGYYIYKFILAFAVAYYVFEYKNKVYGINVNPFNFKIRSIPYFLNWSIIFAVLHGLYYRIFELFTKAPFFSRVGDVRLFSFSNNPIIESIVDWAIIHSSIFFLAVVGVETLLLIKCLKND